MDSYSINSCYSSNLSLSLSLSISISTLQTSSILLVSLTLSFGRTWQEHCEAPTRTHCRASVDVGWIKTLISYCVVPGPLTGLWGTEGTYHHFQDSMFFVAQKMYFSGLRRPLVLTKTWTSICNVFPESTCFGYTWWMHSHLFRCNIFSKHIWIGLKWRSSKQTYLNSILFPDPMRTMKIIHMESHLWVTLIILYTYNGLH